MARADAGPALWLTATITTVWAFLFLGARCEYWNGCVDTMNLKNTNRCYEIWGEKHGDEAWKNWTLFNFTAEYRDSKEAAKLLKTLKRPFLEGGTGGQPVWVGAIEAFPGASTYVTHSNQLVTADRDAGEGGQGCLALHPSEGFKLVRRNCREKLPVLCVFPKYVVHMYGASSDEACRRRGAVSLLPLTGCYVNDEDCDLYRVRIRYEQGSQVVRGRNPVVSIITEMDTKNGTFKKENEHLNHSTQLCYSGQGERKMIRLELRQNKTAGGLTLWVANPGRAAWPPQCVGGQVADAGGDPAALRVVTPVGAEAPPVVWCHARDLVYGNITVSNRVSIADIQKSSACNAAGPPGKGVDAKASCLRCLREALDPCGNKNCTPSCHTGGCGPFHLNSDEWKRYATQEEFQEDIAEFKKCAMNEICAGEVIWKLTGGVDCNRDGIIDCDDRMQRVFSPSCAGEGDVRSLGEGELYWRCRTARRSDFVDITKETGRDRYFCLNDLNLGRHWDEPERLPKIEPYIPVLHSKKISTEGMEVTSPAPTTKEPEMTEKQTVYRLSLLKAITSEKTINDTQMKDFIKNISKLLDVRPEVLHKAQRDTNITSLPEFLETILVRAPVNLNVTTNNLAVSKTHAIGYQLLSDDPQNSNESFGAHPKQHPISNWTEIEKHKERVEAAVILPPGTEKVAVVIVTFAKGDDFLSCKRPTTQSSLKEAQRSNFSRSTHSLPADGPIQAAPAHDDEDEDPEGDEKATDFAHDCPYRKQFLRGCINSHVVQVGLLADNATYVQLPRGKTLDIILRTKVRAMPGQVKRCVYWQPDERGWSDKGCELVTDANARGGLDVCRCSHLTHFAQLVTEGDAVREPHASILRSMSIGACALSLFGLSGVMVAGIAAPRWRLKTENKVMLNLAVAMSLYLVLFLWSALTPKRAVNISRCRPQTPNMNCQGAGAALHYFVLASFCWMLVAAIVQYMRIHPFKDTDSVSLLKASFLGWGLPVIPVATILGVQADTYNGIGRTFCYPTGVAFYAAVLLPIFIVLVANATVFFLILRIIFPNCFIPRKDPPYKYGGNERREMIRKLIVCTAFTFLFGLTWYLGLMSYSVVPAYVFCIVIALQGPAFFIFFVLGEESIRTKFRAYTKRFKRQDDEPISGWIGSSTSTTVLSGNGSSHPWSPRLKIGPKKCATYTVNGTCMEEVQLHDTAI